jgi:hypothetical protein
LAAVFAHLSHSHLVLSFASAIVSFSASSSPSGTASRMPSMRLTHAGRNSARAAVHVRRSMAADTDHAVMGMKAEGSEGAEGAAERPGTGTASTDEGNTTFTMSALLKTSLAHSMRGMAVS